jgi:magnesium-transporting ATPase (P-type)
MDASEFRDIVGDVIRTEEENDKGATVFSYRLTEAGQQQFDQLIVGLKVLGRAEPEDKLRLVAGLRGMTEEIEQEAEDEEGQAESISIPSRRVAVVGEGINDIDAFAAANVSFALQHGSSFARNNASMILQTNDFDSCMRAVMWGRNIYMNVQRFLQFQITANFSVLVVVIVSYLTLTQSALNPVQLIYINLIMDIFGALALSATRPQTDLAKFAAGQGNIMSPYMYRQIFGVTIYMIAIMMVVMYCGKSIFDLSYSAST